MRDALLSSREGALPSVSLLVRLARLSLPARNPSRSTSPRDMNMGVPGFGPQSLPAHYPRRPKAPGGMELYLPTTNACWME